MQRARARRGNGSERGLALCRCGATDTSTAPIELPPYRTLGESHTVARCTVAPACSSPDLSLSPGLTRDTLSRHAAPLPE